MRGRVAVLIAGLVAATTLVPIAGASLSPAEQAWAGPLIKIWNIQNASLKVVISQALKKNALVAGNKPDNLNLTNTLVALALFRAGNLSTTVTHDHDHLHADHVH